MKKFAQQVKNLQRPGAGIEPIPSKLSMKIIDKYANILILQGMYRVRLSGHACTPDQDRTIPQDIELPHINTLDASYKLGILMR